MNFLFAVLFAILPADDVWRFSGTLTQRADGSIGLSVEVVPPHQPSDPDPVPNPIPDPVPSIGWTELTPSTDSRLVYVSSSTGDDANNGTELKPIRTIKESRLRVRNGFPDWVLLKRGDTFSEGRLQWDRGGRSTTEKMVVGSYGEGPRPILDKTGLIFFWRNYAPEYSLDNLAIVDLDFQGRYAIDGASLGNQTAILFSGKCRNHLIEGCRFSNYGTNVHYQWQPTQVAPNENLVFRRNVVVDAMGVAGLLADRIDGVLLEENVFDYNGWGGVGASIFDHNVYLLEVQNATLRNNILARGSNFGAKISSDKPSGCTNFTVENNLFFNNGIGIDHSDGPSGDTQTTFTHQNGIIRNNVFTELGRTFANGGKQDLTAYQLNSQKLVWDGNVFCHKPQVHYGVILAWGGHHKSASVRNNVVYDWHQPVSSTQSDYLLHLADRNVDGMAYERNSINEPSTVFVDAGRTVGSYNVTVGGIDDAVMFLQSCRNQNRDNWNAALTAAAVNDYIRAGFARK